MARFTSIGMPKKTFVASAAEEAHGNEKGDAEAGPSSTRSSQPPAKKKRRGTRGKTQEEIVAARAKEEARKVRAQQKSQPGWGRDPSVARRARLSAQHADERRQRRFQDRDSKTTCFACRSIGHAARDCPNVLLALEDGGEGSAALLGGAAESQESGEGVKVEKRGMKRKAGKKGGDVVGGKCYRCNETTHSLGDCPEPVDPTNPTPFATCYICLGAGHLSSLCPSNPGRGIYVNGGACKVCQSTAHRAKDCPEEAKMKREEAKPRRGEVVLGTAGDGDLGADEDDFMAQSRENLRQGPPSKKMKKKAPNNNGPRAPYASFSNKEAEPAASEPVEPSQTAPARPVMAASKSKPKSKVIAF